MVNRNIQLYSGYACSGVCYGLLHLWCLGNTERHPISIQNGVLGGRHAVLFLCLSKDAVATP